MPAAIAARPSCSARSGRPARPAAAGRFEPDHLPVTPRLRGLVVGLGREQLRAPDLEPGFRLRDVGRVTLPSPAAAWSGATAPAAPQRCSAAVRESPDRAAVHVGGRGVQQHGLFDVAQRLTRREHLALGLPRLVGGLEAVEQVLRHRRADAARRVHSALREIGCRRVRAALLSRFRGLWSTATAMPAFAVIEALRPVAGERGRHVLVGGAHLRALRVELRIVCVGVGEGSLKGLRERRVAAQRRPRDRQSTDRNSQTRTLASIPRTTPDDATLNENNGMRHNGCEPSSPPSLRAKGPERGSQL